MTSRPSMASSSLIVMTAFVGSKIIGLLRDRAIAGQFGAGSETDAYYAAFRVPDLLFTLIAGGALVSAFLPVFSDALARGDEDGAWRVASGVTNLIVIVTAVCAGLAAVVAPWIMSYLAPGFAPEQQALSVSLMRWILLSTLVFAVSGIQMGILNSFQHFLLPAIAPIVYNLGILVGAVALAPRFGVHGLAFGVILGAILHLLVKVPGLIRYGFRYERSLGLRDRGVQQVIRLMWPRMLGLGVVHIVFLVTVSLASRLESGSIAAWNFGWLISQMPQTVLGTAVGIVAFPTLAHLAGRGELDELRRTAVETLRVMIVLAVPAAVGLFVLAGPAIDLLLRTGEFDADAARLTAGPLRMFALGLVGHVTLELLARLFYAQKDTLTPLYIAVVAMGLNIALAVALAAALQVSGLALANSIAVTVEVLLCVAILASRMGGLGGRQLLDALVRSLVAALVMGGAVLWTLRTIPANVEIGPLSGTFLSGLAATGLGGVVGVLVYGATAWVIGIPEIVTFPRRLMRSRA